MLEYFTGKSWKLTVVFLKKTWKLRDLVVSFGSDCVHRAVETSGTVCFSEKCFVFMLFSMLLNAAGFSC